MLTPQLIVTNLQDRDFDAVELVYLLDRMIREQREDAANVSVAQYIAKTNTFKFKRNRRLEKEFDFVVNLLNDERRLTRLTNNQERYKQTRREKNRHRR
jgi:hypothetical protein